MEKLADKKMVFVRKWLIGMGYFFREYTMYNLIFTYFAIDIFLEGGTASYSYIFWLKIFGFITTATIYYWSRKKYFYFFHNFGLSIRELFISAFLIDACLTFLALILSNLIYQWIF
ncbi:MAG: hypothetical protein AAGI07_01380 [Bacteroidota bacterium]